MAKTKTKPGPKWAMKKDQDTIKKLLDGFRSDFTISEACSYAWITTQTYYNRIDNDKHLFDEIEAAKEYCFIMAKNWVRKWLATWDFDSCLKRLKNRQNKIYSEKNEVDQTVKVLSEIELEE